jgi:thiamine-phosphate pyrophosphorylase
MGTETRRVHGLYAIADTALLAAERLASAVEQALAGGARLVQYRNKSADLARREREAAALAVLCRKYHALFIVNDDDELAAAVNADGVHLGRDDALIETARARLGSRALIGVSCYNQLDRALDAQARGADYVAFGSFFASRTKPQAVRASPELLREARTRVTVPIVAIGGITPENGAALIAAGADALAVIDGVFGQPDVRAAAARYAKLFEANHSHP